MATLDVRAKITGPDEIEIPLVRADELHTSNVFRVGFEVCLAVAASLMGVMLSITEITRLHWAFLAFSSIGAACFLYLSLRAVRPFK